MTNLTTYGPLATTIPNNAIFGMDLPGNNRRSVAFETIMAAVQGNAQVVAIIELEGRGEYDSGTLYARNDIVVMPNEGTFLYINDIATTGNAPPNATYWQLLAAVAGQIRSGTGAPGAALGNDGDAYLDDATGIFYTKAGGTWTAVFTIATAANITAAITAHEGSANPHPGYLTPAEVVGVTPITATVSGSNVQIGIDLSNFGQAPGYKYNWVQSAGTTPTSGQVQAAATLTQGAATTLTIHDSDRDGGDVSSELNGLTTGSTIWVLDEASDNNYAQFRLTDDATDNTGTTTLITTCLRLQGTLPAGEVAIVIFPAAGGSGGHVIQEEGTPLAQRSNLNFVGSTVTATDNAGTDTTTITIQGSDLSEGAIIPHQSTAPTTGSAEAAIYPNSTGVLQTRAQNDGTVAFLTRMIRSATPPAASDRRVDTEWVDTSTGVIYRWWPEVDNGNGGWLPITVNDIPS